MTCVGELLRERGVAVACIREDVEDWCATGMLAKKYQGDEDTFGAHALLLGYLRRLQQVARAKATNQVVLVERHPTTSLRVFGVSKATKELFLATADAVPGFLSAVPEYTIYVKNSPRACFDRARARARPEERGLSEYIFSTWAESHDEMMQERRAMGGEVFVIDAFGGGSVHLAPAIIVSMGY